MAEACCIDFKGSKHIFHNKNDEPPHLFIKRCWIKVKNMTTFSDAETLDMVCHAYINVTYNGVKYDDSMMSMIYKLNI